MSFIATSEDSQSSIDYDEESTSTIREETRREAETSAKRRRGQRFESGIDREWRPRESDYYSTTSSSDGDSSFCGINVRRSRGNSFCTKTSEEDEQSETSGFDDSSRGQFYESTRIAMEREHREDNIASVENSRGGMQNSEDAGIETVVLEGDIELDESNKDPISRRREEIRRKVFVDGFYKRQPRRRIVHDIVFVDSVGERNRNFASKCRGSHYSGAVLLIAAHRDHYHVVHDCAYTSSTCRCVVIQAIRGEYRCRRKSVWTFQFTLEHWVALAEYLDFEEREILYLEVPGRVWIDCRQARSIPFERGQRNRPEPLVEESTTSFNFFDYIRCGPEEGNGKSSVGQSIGGRKRCPGSRQRRKNDKIFNLILKISTAPICRVFSTREWTSSEFKYENPASSQMKNIVELVQRKYTESSMPDLIKIYKNATKCYFAATLDYDLIYYDLERSLEIMENILMFQNHQDRHFARKFLFDLYCVCEKKIPKKNAFQVISHPNAGKNLFFDTVIHWYTNFGQIANFNKHSQFPLMDAVNRRICVWNEPSCEASSFEDIKMLFGGDTMKVRVKFQHDAVVDRTPIIILGNNNIFPTDETFKCRMFHYAWRPYNDLKHVQKKLDPNAWIELLKKYKIIDSDGNELDENQNEDAPSDYGITESEDNNDEDNDCESLINSQQTYVTRRFV
jgi:hypothetical protein